MSPLLYEDPVLLRGDLHKHAALLACESFQFAAGIIAVPLNISEFALAARCYPIVFADTETMLPLAVTGLSAASNLFVDDEGRWSDGTYVPAYVRRYPFLPVTTPGSDALMLAIDRPRLIERDGMVREDEPDRLFDGEQASPLAAHALDFCERYHRDHLRTAEFVAGLRDRDLLETRRADIHLPDQSQFRIDGFRMIDRTKLRALPDDCLGDWFRKGWLDLAALAEASQANWQTLLDRHAARGASADTPPARRRSTRKRADA
ncbi:SapC family protein [Sphingosinicella microcystinivorans]|uniref:SapC family protein n=1 Tax=Sphingosinicella microcystinivorans TaxID=335406 RepID=A0AAD1G0W6_SPHMI|nr:SapC family protein [Sphingosinicella microcystinivorans]RKS91139.1 SapC protein [Sphingosinicella microcystinivorans]BBE34060.1 SapC family protein [Sphingosinicella microcystinivorans]